ncbi:MAG TPA: hypothetical protein DCL21_03205 [Alphaproteobacteria bacterium]|nr:hypothetical protein [Alphaproteobacteria bacterium]
MKKNMYAGVDIGSGSARLAICEVVDGKAKTKYFELFGHKLGHDNKSFGTLTEQTMQDTLNTFRKILEKCDDFEVKAVEFSATEAIRAASNSKQFLETVKQELGIDIRILHEKEEATFAYLGAQKLFKDSAENVLVMDIGRGSIELALGSLNQREPKEYISHKLGTMVFRDLLDSKTDLDKSFNKIIQQIKTDFNETINTWDIDFKNSDQLIGLGMSLFTYGYIHGLTESEMVKGEGKELTLDELYSYAEDQLENLRNEVCHRSNKGVLSQGDVPVLATLIALLESAGLDSITLGRTRIPQGIALELASK